MMEPPCTKKSRGDSNMSKSSGKSSMSTEVMERQIWKDFPEDLLEAVIARLPIATFFRFRSVCRRWNSLLTCQSFSQHCAQVPQAKPWFYTRRINAHEHENYSGAMYDPCMKKWYHPIGPTLPTKCIVLPVASAGGLVCILHIGDSVDTLHVGNPLIQAFKELPAASFNSCVGVGMTVVNGINSAGDGYKILWVDRHGEFQIFDSVRKSWSCPKTMPADIKLPLPLSFRSQAVSIDSTLYFIRSEAEGIVSLLSYDMETGVWKKYMIPAPLHLDDHTLAECDGRIMLVGLLRNNDDIDMCVCIWELQKMTLLWKEVDRMPDEWCLDFYGKYVRMTCLGNRGFLMLTLLSRQMDSLVTYNIARKEWVKVPGAGSVVPLGKKWEWSGTSFHPSLTAIP